MTQSTARFATEYETHTRRCSCTCGWRKVARDDEHADRLLEDHTTAHRLLVEAGVA